MFSVQGDSSPGEEHLVGHVCFFAPCAHKEPLTGAQAKQRCVKKAGPASSASTEFTGVFPCRGPSAWGGEGLGTGWVTPPPLVPKTEARRGSGNIVIPLRARTVTRVHLL